MALNKEKKSEVVAEVSELLANSKLTVIAKYDGTSVKSMQELRRLSAESGTKVKVVKNRLFKRVLESDDRFSDIQIADLTGQLLYAFNNDDEVATAQSLADFAKLEPQVAFIAGLTAEGQLLSPDDLKALASLPSKDQLRAQLVGTIAAPLSGFVNVIAGNVRGVLNVLSARSEQLS